MPPSSVQYGNLFVDPQVTWQFMSVRLQEDADAAHEVRDDIESFLHVALWIAARYIRNGMTPDKCSAFLKPFDETRTHGPKATILMLGRGALQKIMLTTPEFAKLMGNLLYEMAFLQNQGLLDDLKSHGIDVSERQGRMLTHNWMADTLESALRQETWKGVRDGAVDNKLAAPAVATSNSERSRGCMDELSHRGEGAEG